MKHLVSALFLVALAVPSVAFAVQPVQQVPEPASALLIAAGSLGAAGYARLRKRAGKK